MDIPSGALLLHSSNGKDPLMSRGSSGISISKDWVLTHGTLLSPIIDKSHALSSFIKNMSLGELMVMPKKFASELRFRIYRNLEKETSNLSRTNNDMRIQEHCGTIAAVWKCSLLKKTFDEFFETWNFPKSSDYDQLLRPIFLLIRISDFDQSIMDISTIEQVLFRLLDRTLRNPVRGLSVEIESTPFGNPVFIDSIARGVISNVVGDEGCVIMTDAYAFPGGEGGPVYVISPDCKRRIIIGMVIAPLSWCRGEWVDYTFATNLAPCLLNILLTKNSCPSIMGHAYHKNANEALDTGVVLVRCGISWGTGILVDKDTGTFLTCSHVVAEAPEREISIVMNTSKPISSRVQSKLLYKTPDDQPYDVAVLRMDPRNLDPSLKPVKLSHAPILKGEPVISVGFPFSSSIQPTISSGVVSKSLDCALLTTCCVQSGTSGGPIVNRATGEMLGMIVCNALSSDGTVLYPRMSLAVPAALLSRPLQEYLRTDNCDALRAFTCDDAAVCKVWNFYPILPSKL